MRRGSVAVRRAIHVIFISRQYATLFFFIVDESESELGILDLIQVFVETLDRCFENVCELDIIFNMERVSFVLDEIVVGGCVLETSMADILAQIDAHRRKEVEEAPPSVASVAASMYNRATGGS
mmetsp:Transcript_25956/g.64857  ORF Transcript_25956/g.64857 Transcript_25956/m.64857 type:complete len:124 (+) Transcript_25956:84-455(+)